MSHSLPKRIAWLVFSLLVIAALYLSSLWFSHPFKAAAEGRLDVVKFHIWNGSDINESTTFRMSSASSGISFLHYAAMGGQTDVMQWLIEQGADLEAVTVLKKRTALHYAANNSEFKAVRLLLEQGVDINFQDKAGDTPLMLAIDRKRLGDGENVTRIVKPNYQQRTIDLLLQSGADAKISSHSGITTLMAAARHRDLELIKKLKTLGVDVNARSNGRFAHYAVEHLLHSNIYDAQREQQEPVVLNWLIHNMDQQNLSELKNKRLLHKTCNAELLRILISYKFDVNAPLDNHSTDTPLHSALKKQQCDTEILDILIRAGADINAVNNDQKSTLHLAVASYNHQKLDFILDKIEDVQLRDAEGNTALHELLTVDKKMLDMLLATGLDINARNHAGETLLHALVGLKQQDCSRLNRLIAAGADPAIKNNNGQTALDLVSNSQYMQLNSKAESCLNKL